MASPVIVVEIKLSPSKSTVSRASIVIFAPSPLPKTSPLINASPVTLSEFVAIWIFPTLPTPSGLTALITRLNTWLFFPSMLISGLLMLILPAFPCPEVLLLNSEPFMSEIEPASTMRLPPLPTDPVSTPLKMAELFKNTVSAALIETLPPLPFP